MSPVAASARKVHLSPELAALVKVYIDSVHEDWADHPTNVREIAQRIRAVPLSLDMGGFFALKLDGSIVGIGWDEPNVEQPIGSIRERDIALLAGSRRYPALATLLPSRPTDAKLCFECGGTGVHPFAATVGENLLCWCGGFGWIPEEWMTEK